MNYKEFFSKLKKDDIENYYLFTGEEEYMMSLALERLKDKYIDDSFEALNYTRLEGKTADLDAIINATETLPFMSEKKIIILRDVSPFLKELENREKEELYNMLDDLGDFLVLIFLDSNSELHKNTKLYKMFKKKNRQLEFNKLFGSDMNDFVNSIMNKNEKKISSNNIKYFVNQTNYNSRDSILKLYDLENELLKVVDYAKEEEITKKDIDSILVKTSDTNIFKFLDAFSSKSVEKSLELLNQMCDSGEPIQRIFHMMTREVRLLLGFCIYKEKGYENNSIQKKLGISWYEFKDIPGKARRYTRQELQNMLKKLVDIDRQMKTTIVDDKLIVESFLVETGNSFYINK